MVLGEITSECVYMEKKGPSTEGKKKQNRNKHLEGVINEVGSIPSNTVSRNPN